MVDTIVLAHLKTKNLKTDKPVFEILTFEVEEVLKSANFGLLGLDFGL